MENSSARRAATLSSSASPIHCVIARLTFRYHIGFGLFAVALRRWWFRSEASIARDKKNSVRPSSTFPVGGKKGSKKATMTRSTEQTQLIFNYFPAAKCFIRRSRELALRLDLSKSNESHCARPSLVGSSVLPGWLDEKGPKGGNENKKKVSRALHGPFNHMKAAKTDEVEEDKSSRKYLSPFERPLRGDKKWDFPHSIGW